MIQQIGYYLISMRPKQWIKNGIILVPLIFSGSLFHTVHLLESILVFFLFSFLAGSLYVVNDIIDVQNDRKHSKKKHRPIATKKLNIFYAGLVSIIVAVSTIIGAFFLISIPVGELCSIYAINTLNYSYFLKRVVFLDVFVIAFGFVIRAMIGIYTIKVDMSWWLIWAVFIGAIILGLLKRYQEIQLGGASRTILGDYKKYPLKESIIFFSCLLVALYGIYTIYSIQPKIFIITIPCIVFGVWRFLYSIFSLKKYSSGFEDIIFEDPYIIADIVVYLLIVIGLIYLV